MRKILYTLPLLLLAAVSCAQAQGLFGNALAFNGVNQYVSVANFGAIAPTNEVTLEFWAYANTFAQQSAFMLQPDDPNNRFNSHISYNNGNTYWDFGDIDTSGRVFAPNPPNSITNWIHYALVASQNGGYMKIYTNGNLMVSSAAMTPFVRGSYELRIGGNSGYFFNGQLDEFRVWNTALSQAQIQSNLNTSLAGNEAGLLLYYRFDSASGTVAANSATATGAAYNGTLVNSPSWVLSGAASRVVTTTADSGVGSLRQTIANAATGGTITFSPSLSGQTIVIKTGVLTLGTNLTIDGSALAGGIQINANSHGRIFQVNSSATVVLNSLFLTDGATSGSDGGAILNQGSLTVNDCTFLNNEAFQGHGGAIANLGTLNVDVCTFTSNTATLGAAIYNSSNGSLSLSASTISGNSILVSNGAASSAIHLVSGVCVLTNSIVSGNLPGDITGTVSASSRFNLIGMGGNLIGGVNGNQTGVTNPMLSPLSYYGGPMPTMPPLAGSPAIDTGGMTHFPLDQRGFTRPSPTDIGAVEFQKSTVVSTVRDSVENSLRAAVYYSPAGSTITFDPALSGWAITLKTGMIVISNNLTIDASSLPGGILIDGNMQDRIFQVPAGVTAVLNKLFVADGFANVISGGGAVLNQGNLTVNYCTFANNSTGALGKGGAIANDNTLTVNVCTFTGNSAPRGGAIYNFLGQSNNSTLTVSASTISANTASSTGGGTSGGIYLINANCTLTNTIVSGNFANGASGDIDGSVSGKSRFNLIGVGGGLVNGVNGNQVGVSEPMLTSLGYYGGPLPTMPPLIGSPAIDTGGMTHFPLDQRGFTRPSPTDIGAVEFQKSTVVSTVRDSVENSLRAAVYYSPAGSTVTFTPALSGQVLTLTNELIIISNNLTIDASSLPGGILIDGNMQDRIFQVPAGVTAVLNKLFIADGFANVISGGGAVLNQGNLTVNYCTFANNSTGALGRGGAIANDNTLTVNVCTFTGNSARRGGAIYSSINIQGSNSTLTVSDSTISGNNLIGGTDTASGGIYLTDANCTLTNTIVSGNFANGASGDIGGSVSANSRFNLIGVGGGLGGVGNGNHNQIGVTNPMLSPLGDYGGPLPTMPPLAGSPAIDTGGMTHFPLDQRGFPRPLGLGLDVGAVEGVYNAAGPGLLTGMTRLVDGSARFNFTNYTDTSYTVFASTNLTLPFNTWSNLGPAVESPVGSGQFQFTDASATNNPMRFYRVRSP